MACGRVYMRIGKRIVCLSYIAIFEEPARQVGHPQMVKKMSTTDPLVIRSVG